MKTYKCRRCGHIAYQKIQLQNHLNKQKECESIYEDIDRSILLNELKKKIVIFDCKKCGKTFSSRQSKWTHEKKCEYSKEIKCITEIKVINENEIKELKNEIIEIKKILLKTQLNQNMNSNNTNSNIISNSNNTNYINNTTYIIQNLRPFGEENYDYVTRDTIRHILRRGAKSFLFEFVKFINFNINHSENWNCFISNLKNNKINIFTGSCYEIRDRNIILNKLIDGKKDFLEGYLVKSQEEIKLEKEYLELDINTLKINLKENIRNKYNIDIDEEIPDEELKYNEELNNLIKNLKELNELDELIEEILDKLSQFDDVYKDVTLTEIEEEAYKKRDTFNGVKKECERLNKEENNRVH
jgi:hypothetical protein